MMRNTKPKTLVVIQCYEDRQQTLPLRKVENGTSDSVTSNYSQLKRDPMDSPPPPPPMPTVNAPRNGDIKKIESDKSKTINTDLNKTISLKNGTLTRTPTPDYNKNSLNNNNKDSASHSNNIKDEKAELESLESYKLKNPLNIEPKPPSNYFKRAPNGTATMKKHSRPVSVTIGEYAGVAGGRREPSKLEFLNGEKIEGSQCTNDVPISNRLQSELALTLSRSNLRKKTDAMADAGR